MKTKREKRRIVIKTYEIIGILFIVVGSFTSLWISSLIDTGVIEATVFYGVLSWELIGSLLVTFLGLYIIADACKTRDRLKLIGKF